MYCTGNAIGYFEQSDEHIICSPISIPAACFQLLTIKATYQQTKPFSKDKTFCFNDCIGNTAYYNDILIILCANQSPHCVSGDLQKESYLWWNLWRTENIANCTMHLFFLVTRWANSKNLQNRVQEGKYNRSFFPPSFVVHAYTCWKNIQLPS